MSRLQNCSKENKIGLTCFILNFKRMMRFLFVTLLTAVATWFAITFMPWWSILLVAFLIALMLPMKNGKSFLATGLGAAIAWLLISLSADLANDHILGSRMATLMLKTPSYGLMIAITALVGFITAGLGGWTGAAVRNMFRQPKSKEELFVSQQSQP
jgi:hypothetical protein